MSKFKVLCSNKTVLWTAAYFFFSVCLLSSQLAKGLKFLWPESSSQFSTHGQNTAPRVDKNCSFAVLLNSTYREWLPLEYASFVKPCFGVPKIKISIFNVTKISLVFLPSWWPWQRRRGERQTLTTEGRAGIWRPNWVTTFNVFSSSNYEKIYFFP